LNLSRLTFVSQVLGRSSWRRVEVCIAPFQAMIACMRLISGHLPQPTASVASVAQALARQFAEMRSFGWTA
jgi:hypothetical protein